MIARWMTKATALAAAQGQGTRNDRPDLGASEIGDFAFCARGWWLKRVKGVALRSAAQAAGTAAHRAAGAQVAQVVALEVKVKLLAGGVGLVAAVMLARVLFGF